MLNRLENKIMDYLFIRCRGKKTVLVPPQDILQSILPKYEITAKQLEAHMKNLVLDGYIDLFNSDDKGKLVYVVTLKQKGEAFKREHDDVVKRRWRSLGWKILLTIIGFVLGTVLIVIFRR